MSQTRKPESSTKEAAAAPAPSFFNSAALVLSPLFGKRAKTAVEKSVGISPQPEIKKPKQLPGEEDADIFDGPESVSSFALPPVEPMPLEIAASVPALQIASPRPFVFSPRRETGPAADFLNSLDDFARMIAEKAKPTKDYLYPFRITQAAMRVEKEIRQHLCLEKTFLALSRKQQAEYTQLLFMLKSTLTDYPKFHKEQDPSHPFNATLRQLTILAKTIDGSTSVRKIIAGVVFAFIGLVGMGCAIGASFISAGALSLPAFGLFGISAKLAAAGVTGIGVFVAYHGRRKGEALAVENFVNDILIERKIK